MKFTVATCTEVVIHDMGDSKLASFPCKKWSQSLKVAAGKSRYSSLCVPSLSLELLFSLMPQRVSGMTPCPCHLNVAVTSCDTKWKPCIHNWKSCVYGSIAAIGWILIMSHSVIWLHISCAGINMFMSQRCLFSMQVKYAAILHDECLSMYIILYTQLEWIWLSCWNILNCPGFSNSRTSLIIT